MLIVSAVGAVLALQGWRSRVPGTDLIPYIDSVRDLLAHGRVPEHGVVTSRGSYSPPGYVWAVVPGMALLRDVRLFDVPGTIALHIGTTVGIFLLARRFFGLSCALLATVLYGLSERGIALAATVSGPGSLGVKGHPIFYVWMAYCLCRWVAERDSRYLAGACATYIAGMFVFMEMAPAALMIPAAWVIYRPPIRWRLLAAVGVLGIVMWLPYLRFESAHAFSDVRGQLLLQDVMPASYSAALCDHGLTQRRWGSGVATSDAPEDDGRRPSFVTRATGFARRRATAAIRGLTGNFNGLVPGTAIILLVLTIGGVVRTFRRSSDNIGAQALSICLLVPWVVLVTLMEPAREDRVAGLWPLQVVVLAATVLALNAWINRRRLRMGWLAPAILVLLVLVNPQTVSRMASWQREGWSGTDAVEMQLAEYVARRAHEQGRPEPSIGYRLFADGPPTAPPNRTDDRWKVGEEFDVVLEYAGGLVNRNQCMEGISRRDDYRVVELSPPSRDAKYYFDVPADGQLRLLRRFGPYEVFERQ